ncbi:MAG: formylglycine-generating enzyme family protein [Nitrospirota bacterium]
MFRIFAMVILFTLYACAHTQHAGIQKTPGMITIPQGWFTMGSADGEDNEQPLHEVYVDTFEIDRHEVSADQFAEFLNSRGNPKEIFFSHDPYSTIIRATSLQGKHPEGEDTSELYLPREGYANFPANNVSWYGAFAYCQWRGKRLPTEAEWEKTARGDDKRTYPWGNSMPDGSKARFNQTWNDKGLNVMVPVDALPGGTSYYGAFNMAGNVWEWVDTWYQRHYCKDCPEGEDNPCLPCKQEDACSHCPAAIPTEGDFKVLRGGSWYDSYGEIVVRSSYRYWLHPEDRFIHTGFRCAQ